MDHTHEGWPVPHSDPIPLRDWDDIDVIVHFSPNSMLSISWSVRSPESFLSQIHSEVYDIDE